LAVKIKARELYGTGKMRGKKKQEMLIKVVWEIFYFFFKSERAFLD